MEYYPAADENEALVTPHNMHGPPKPYAKLKKPDATLEAVRFHL